MKKNEKNLINYEKKLKLENLSENTVKSYLWTINYFLTHYKKFTPEKIKDYKCYLLDNYNVKTVNNRLQAINNYLKYAGICHYQIKFVKNQQKNYLENVISNSDYQFFKESLKNDKRTKWYFIVAFLGATGARVSELIKFKAEHIQLGYIDLYTKGGKIRRIYIPATLRREALEWLTQEKINRGYLFKNRYGEQISSRGIEVQLKKYAVQYGLNPNVIYPHSFRHRFAKNFLEKYKDIALLADLMGHESIETTRIYLRKTSYEQQKIVDTIITW